MRLGFLAGMAAVCVVGVALVLKADGPDPSNLPSWVPDSIETILGRSEEGHVFVFVVGSPEGVRHIRAAVSSERVVAMAKDAFALKSGRIVAASVNVLFALGP